MAGIRHQEVSSPVPAGIFIRFVQYVFFIAGVMALTYVGYIHVRAQIFQADQSQQLEQLAKLDQRVPLDGFPIATVKVPRIGIETVVVQGDSAKILSLAVGHIPGTALPGQPGNMVLAGHRDTFFRPLRNIRIGDRIEIETPKGSIDYQVESASVVFPTDLSVLRNSGGRELTLITCYPFSWIGSAPDRFVVRARQI
jgi:sortase A